MIQKAEDYLSYLNEILKETDNVVDLDRTAVYERIEIINNRLNDENLYVGVIGAFSSGKSTFINALLDENLLPTDAVQQTTVTTSIIKSSEKNDLEIKYTDGNVQRYSSDKNDISNYYSDVFKAFAEESSDNELSFWEKLIQMILILFHLKKCKEEDFEDEIKYLFRTVISSEEYGKNIESATLELDKSHKIIDDIAVIDTPGLDSLNYRHDAVTKNAIKNLCDAIVIIIPADTPASESLLNYVQENLSEQIDSCIFVLTKVESLNEFEELPRLLKVTSKRIGGRLKIDTPNVIALPTLIHLENTAEDVHTGLFDNIDEDNKQKMLHLYDENIDIFKDFLFKNKDKYIVNRIYDSCITINKILEEEFKNKIAEERKMQEKLKKIKLKDINDFISHEKDYIRVCRDEQIENIMTELMFLEAPFADILNEFASIVENSVSTEALIRNLRDIEGYDILSMAKQPLNEYKNKIYELYNELADGFAASFLKEYGICSVKISKSKPSNDYFWDMAFETELEVYNNTSIGQYESELNDLASTIFADSDKLWSIFKSIFSDPLPQYKDMCKSKINPFILDSKDEWYEIFYKFVKEFTETLYDDLEKYVNNIKNENYSKVKQFLSEKDRRIAESNEYIKKLRMYNENLQKFADDLKEVN